MSHMSARENAIEQALRTHGQIGIDNSIVYKTLEQTLINKFQILYDVFFKIIRNRL